jgi:protocatechuate 3,4-dioxygenase beta subunit
MRPTTALLSGLLVGAAMLSGIAQNAPKEQDLNSGIKKGGVLPAFNPQHVTGPDKGTQVCPVWKYGMRPAVQVWVNTDNTKNVGAIASALEKAVNEHSDKELKAFVIFIKPKEETDQAITKQLEDLAADKKLDKIGMAYIPGPKDEAAQGYQINTDPKVKNTVFVYKQKTVEDRFVNLKGDDKGITSLNKAIANVLK